MEKQEVYVTFHTGQVLAAVEDGSDERPCALRGSGQRTLQCRGLYRLLQVRPQPPVYRCTVYIS